MQAEVLLGLGSNLGDRRRNMAEAVGRLRAVSSALRLSSLHETQPEGFAAQPLFLNAACRLWTRLDPFQLLVELMRIQRAIGPGTVFGNGPRAMDIDILMYGRTVLSMPHLTIPHPRMAARRFVLAPLAEVAPDVTHAVLGRTVKSLLKTQPDPGRVRAVGPLSLPPPEGPSGGGKPTRDTLLPSSRYAMPTSLATMARRSGGCRLY